MNFPLRPRRALRFLVVPLTLAAMLAALAATPDQNSQDSPATLTPVAARTSTGTSFQIGSLNLLGASHTDGKNPRKGYAKSPVRLVAARQALDTHQVDVVGLQEMHASQATAWVANNKAEFGTYPGTSLKIWDAQRSISWRTSKFSLVQAHTLNVPYFGGRIEKMPYILLQAKATGQLFWVYNAHNPANVEGPALKYRQQGWDKMLALVAQLRRNYPGVPVFTTGDMNDRSNFFCRVMGNSELKAANGGTATPTSCSPPPNMGIDWITGTAPNVFTEYASIRDALIKKATDHPLVRARVNIPGGPMSASPAKRAIVVTVEGLRSYSMNPMVKQGKLPGIARMKAQGASTMNARTAVESTMPLPNLVSTLTGRVVHRSAGGHGVKSEKYRGTVHRAAGQYVPSVLEMVANTGGSTSLYSSNSSVSTIHKSWNAAGSRPRVEGGPRTTKIGRYGVYKSDAAVVAQFRRTAKNPTTYTHLHFSEPARAGRKYGFKSKQYQAALRKVDGRIRTVRGIIGGSRTMLGSTMLFVVGTSGGYQKSPWLLAKAGNYSVPILVTGAGVQPAGDLYAMNPTRRSPGTRRVAYSAAAITTADVANLVLASLKLPALPGSTQNTTQQLTVLRTR